MRLEYGSHYDPFVAALILAVVDAIGTLVWGPETLARYRDRKTIQGPGNLRT